MGKILKKKPLIEAIFELRWKLESIGQGASFDKNYNFIPGMFFSKISKDFPIHTQLPTASVPPEMIPYAPQYQFRKEEKKWPVIQLGSGILTVNETENYKWENGFEELCKYAFTNFQEVYPEKEKLEIIDIKLRYLNSLPLNGANVLDLLKEKLKIEIGLPEKLFSADIGSNPVGFQNRFTYPVKNPKGNLLITFQSGKVKEIESVIWELQFVSVLQTSMKDKDFFSQWLNDAHKIIEDSFLTLVDGDLLRSFENG